MFKYIVRREKKNDLIGDLEKARDYLDYEIEYQKKRQLESACSMNTGGALHVDVNENGITYIPDPPRGLWSGSRG